MGEGDREDQGMTGMTPAELEADARAYARRSRAEQGMPPRLTDPEVIRHIGVLLRATGDGRSVTRA